jgi:hypothetical protein
LVFGVLARSMVASRRGAGDATTAANIYFGDIMGFFRFRRILKIIPGVRVNISKTGSSLSIGKRGATVNAGKRGVYTTIGIPGSGLSYRPLLDRDRLSDRQSGCRARAWRTLAHELRTATDAAERVACRMRRVGR